MDKQIDKTVLLEKNPQKQSLLHVLAKCSTEYNMEFEKKVKQLAHADIFFDFLLKFNLSKWVDF